MEDLHSLLRQRAAQAPIRQAAPAGYTAPASCQGDPDLEAMADLAAAVLADPLALQTFSDQVYACLRHDMQQQRSRRGEIRRYF
ncbi:hypothetical protein [Leptolyngbya sp. PCC 6406]|uniref:hypothetical protein n=1 Tax=Leptolyngbya sp. PCC 6406 TaxID=1173264 RepID=UPI0002AD16C9|nr:hypothetical protein [Leptolyngbya sp. PCC 6406]